MAGELAVTQIGLFDLSGVSGANLVETAIEAQTLAATTDKLVVLPVANGQQVMVFKVERTA